jgi:hypothetical protein
MMIKMIASAYQSEPPSLTASRSTDFIETVEISEETNMDTNYDDDLDEDDDTLIDRIIALNTEHGEEVAYQDWDSGACGAGAGHVAMYEYEGQFYVIGEDDCPLHGPYPAEQAAVDAHQIGVINSATAIIWERDAGIVYDKAEDGDLEEDL